MKQLHIAIQLLFLSFLIFSCTEENKSSKSNSNEPEIGNNEEEKEYEGLDQPPKLPFIGFFLECNYDDGCFYSWRADENQELVDKALEDGWMKFYLLYEGSENADINGIMELPFPFPSNYSGFVEFRDHSGMEVLATGRVINGERAGMWQIMSNEVAVACLHFQEGEIIVASNYFYALEWEYRDYNNNLIIYDKKNAYSKEDGDSSILYIGKSFRKENKTSLTQLIEKENFLDTFRVHHEPYTGTIKAYYDPNRVYYEISFKNGLLDGDFFLFDETGDLELHEIFDEGEFMEIRYSKDQMEDGLAKPIIYLYPKEETEVSVKIDLEGELTHTYPKYKDGWKVTAFSDGTIKDAKGRSYYSLYWEGESRTRIPTPNGNVIKGEHTAAFLEAALDSLGLTEKEANEFIIYWLPMMENNPYNFIHFSTDAYADIAKLEVEPKPETSIRIMMVFEALDQFENRPQQYFSGMKKERKGFTLVEWGGAQRETKTIN